jgi:hypothetical protein
VIFPILAVSTAANVAVSVLTSSFVSSAIFYWLTARKERSQFLRGKLEELFMAYQSYCKLVFTNIYMPYRSVMTGEIDYNQALDLVISTPKDMSRHHETCEMVIRLYFDEFLPAWDELSKRRENLNSVHAEFRRSYKEGEETRRFINPFDSAIAQFEKQEEILRDSIISKARKLTPPHRL